MKYTYFRSSILLSLSILFSIGIFVYHFETGKLIKKHLMLDMQNDIRSIKYDFYDDLRHYKINNFRFHIKHMSGKYGMIGSIYILDSRKKVIMSSDKRLEGTVFNKNMISTDRINLNNFSDEYSYFSRFSVKNGQRTAVYYLVVNPKMNTLQKGIIHNMHRTMAFFALFVALLMAVVLAVTQLVIVRPISLLRKYTESTASVPPKFFIKEFERLRLSTVSHIQRITDLQRYTRTILDSQNDIIFVSDGKKLTNANKAFFTFFSEFSTVDDFNMQFSCVCEVFEKSDKLNYLCRSDKKENEWIKKILEEPMVAYRVKISKGGIPFIFSINVGKMSYGGVEQYVVVLTDVTLVEGYQDNLEMLINEEVKKRTKAEDRYRYIFNSMAEGLCIHSFGKDNKPSQFIEVNDRMADMLGYSREELLKMTPGDLNTADSNKNVAGTVNVILEHKFAAFETELIKKSGEVIFCEMNSKLLDFYGQKTIITSINDITPKVQLQNHMKEQEKIIIQQSKLTTLGEMLGSISHQWKQPLNAISLLSDCIRDMVNEKGCADEEINGCFSQISEQIQFMAQTMSDFKNFYKPSKESKEFSVSGVVTEMYNILKPQYLSHGLILFILKDATLSDNVTGFPSEFKQVVMNLLNNTKDALDERKRLPEYKNIVTGDVTVKISEANGMVTMDYCDNCGGIPDEIMENMFRPYNTSKGEKGVGIGMHISRQIIENMGGSISAMNTETGARFIITLKKQATA